MQLSRVRCLDCEHEQAAHVIGLELASCQFRYCNCPHFRNYVPSPIANPERWVELCRACGHVRYRHRDDKGACTKEHDGVEGTYACMCDQFVPCTVGDYTGNKMKMEAKPQPRYDLFESGPMRRVALRWGVGAYKDKPDGEAGYKTRSNVHNELIHIQQHLNHLLVEEGLPPRAPGDRTVDDLAAIACRALQAMWLEDDK